MKGLLPPERFLQEYSFAKTILCHCECELCLDRRQLTQQAEAGVTSRCFLAEAQQFVLTGLDQSRWVERLDWSLAEFVAFAAD